MNIILAIAATVLGFLFLKAWDSLNKLTKAIYRLESSIDKLQVSQMSKSVKQEPAPHKQAINADDLLSILETSDTKTKQRIKEILHV